MSQAFDPQPSDEIGPIDYLVVEYPGANMTGEALPYFLDLVDRGVIRVLDTAFIIKDAEDSYRQITAADIPVVGDTPLEVFEGSASGMLDEDDLAQVAAVIGVGSAAGVLVYENAWAGPFGAALRRAGAQLVADGRIPTQAILAALESQLAD
jgi:Family of unknown function (DUF6325)